MIAKIGRSGNLYGALAYNQAKVERENAKVLLMSKMIETPNGRYSTTQLAQSFASYLIANRNTEKPVLHISLNPDPSDKVSDEQYREMAEEYMREMGYGNQPFVVFKHTDIGRSHIHIVSVCVDETGRKISDKFEKRKSMQVCRDLETKFGLIPASEKKHGQNDTIFAPVVYFEGDVKSQIASVVRHLPKYYKFQTLGQYNALLSLFNITAEAVTGEKDGQEVKGLVYSALDANGGKVGNPFKASLFGKKAGLTALEKHFAKSKAELKGYTGKPGLQSIITGVLQAAPDEQGFRKKLIEAGINVVIRRNNSGRIYGVTFIDHTSRILWNGSQLGKGLSANTFNELWKQDSSLDNYKPIQPLQGINGTDNLDNLPGNELHPLFDLTGEVPDNENSIVGLSDALGGLLPGAIGDDYEALAFAKKMKKKKKRKKGRG